MRKDIGEWVRSCVPCQRAKVYRHTKAPVSSFSPPVHRFDHVYIDLVVSLPSSHGYTYLLTCVDRFTRWPEAIPLPDVHAATVAAAFVNIWVSRFGVPGTITTDRGGQFEAALFQALVTLLSYHPQANGLVECFHRRLKAALRASPSPQQWVDHLPFILLSIRTATKADSDTASCELVYGSSLRLPSEFFLSSPQLLSVPTASTFVHNLQASMRKLQPVRTRSPAAGPVTFVPQDLKSATKVFLGYPPARVSRFIEGELLLRTSPLQVIQNYMYLRVV